MCDDGATYMTSFEVDLAPGSTFVTMTWNGKGFSVAPRENDRSRSVRLFVREGGHYTAQVKSSKDNREVLHSVSFSGHNEPVQEVEVEDSSVGKD